MSAKNLIFMRAVLPMVSDFFFADGLCWLSAVWQALVALKRE
jgi:hypothetical protein